MQFEQVAGWIVAGLTGTIFALLSFVQANKRQSDAERDARISRIEVYIDKHDEIVRDGFQRLATNEATFQDIKVGMGEVRADMREVRMSNERLELRIGRVEQELRNGNGRRA